VSVKSLQGGLCQILPNLNGPVKISSAQPVKMIDKGNGEYEMMLKKGQEVFLFTNENALNTPISETSQIIGKSNYWGKKIKPYYKEQ